MSDSTDSANAAASDAYQRDMDPPRHKNSNETTSSSVPSLTQSASTSSAKSDRFESKDGDLDAEDRRRRSAEFTASPSPNPAPHVEIVGDDDEGSLARQLERMGMENGSGEKDRDSDVTVADDEGDKDPFDGLDPVVRYTADLYAWTKIRYDIAIKDRDRMDKQRQNGGKPGQSGIERMGKKTGRA